MSSRLCGAQRASAPSGHLGTLDPMATGVLPLLLGKYTRLAQFFGQAEKYYTGTIRFGFATDTFDAEGEPQGEPQPLTHSLEQLRADRHVLSRRARSDAAGLLREKDQWRSRAQAGAAGQGSSGEACAHLHSQLRAHGA